jgi:flagellin
MALRVNTNVEAINIQKNLSQSQARVADSLKKLSSGHRIESAKDDASGLAIANFFKAKVSSMRVAYQNASESNSMLQVADGAYSNVHDILVRMKDLATQAAGGQIEDNNRAQLNTEFVQLQNELDRISQSTKYGGQTMVYSTGAGQMATMSFQIGATNASTDQITVQLNAVSTGALGVSTNVGIGSAASASATMAALDTALGSVNTYMGTLGAYQNRLSMAMQNLQVGMENFSASESAIRDVDMAYQVTQFTKDQILQQSGMAMLAQANQAPQQILQLLGG